jgi:hypothetical protein
VKAGEKMNLVFAFIVTARASAVIPEIPVLHHGANSKEVSNMFGNPELVERRKEVCCCLHCIPINIREGQTSEALLVQQKGTQLDSKNCLAGSLCRVGGKLDLINIRGCEN